MNQKPLPDAVAALFPNASDRERIGSWLNLELEAALQRIQAGPVAPASDVHKFRIELERFDFTTPQPLEDALRWTIDRMEHGIVQMSNPRYFGLFNPGANFPAQCADRIAGLFNPQLASSASSPLPVALESHVIRAVATRAGMAAEATGHFATGGSEANYTALLCALTGAHPAFSTEGARAFAGPAKFYTSRDCHIAWLKIAHQPDRVDMHAVHDRAAGAVPVMIVATAGTTGGGMIDPLHACADIASQQGLWYHVDAAWGGAVLASNRLRGLLNGIERADSITIDAHKWLATTMGCAMFLTRRGPLLSEAFHASTSFMPSSISGIDPYLNSMQSVHTWIAVSRSSNTSNRGCSHWDGASPMTLRSRCWRRSRPLNWEMCELWCGGWWPPGVPGWRRPLLKAATWCVYARPTGKLARKTSVR